VGGCCVAELRKKSISSACHTQEKGGQAERSVRLSAGRLIGITTGVPACHEIQLTFGADQGLSGSIDYLREAD
jgi:hypothetical protein